MPVTCAAPNSPRSAVSAADDAWSRAISLEPRSFTTKPHSASATEADNHASAICFARALATSLAKVDLNFNSAIPPME